MEFFPKGLVRGFGPKMAVSYLLFFGQSRPGKSVL